MTVHGYGDEFLTLKQATLTPVLKMGIGISADVVGLVIRVVARVGYWMPFTL
jgi:hypothetical protein